ncbi:response regulator [Gillisia hiemivivida]|jgi:CheY-like chemotaxis protein|uniref:Response regulator n=1 Tax=Gillisia hiemivivida TaxID=291190 RepID=A0A5C6ZU62_9FLAO|nr:response regulator [Gillisia hiemivivida]TXD92345.1 response regulator [Gillisia hiemivivida]
MEYNTVEILLIEDNMNDAELAIRAFRKGNISNNLIHLKDGAQALEFLFGTGKFEGRDTSIKPKVILLDLKMPKMDGLEVLTHIKANKLTKAIPVVVLTSSKEHPDIERAYSLGANSYIVKPVEFDEFTKIVADLGFYWLLKNQPPV